MDSKKLMKNLMSFAVLEKWNLNVFWAKNKLDYNYC